MRQASATLWIVEAQALWKLGLAAQRPKKRGFKELLEKRKLPVDGWPDEHIEELVHQIASLDSNNFPHKVGLGEREARIACRLVSRRHYNFGHGIGRSGDLLEPQPKAAGSTLLAHLTNALILDLMQGLGLPSCRGCFLVPMCTGMTITLCLQSLRKQRPLAKYVLWSRIDQKSCFKAITAAGLEPVIVPCLVQHQALSTDVNAFEQKIEALGAETILCLYTTTSCFAPRNSDSIVEIAQLAKPCDLPHLVNNAYGLQIGAISRQLERAHRLGRIDYFVQSTDKNFLVPVGGAIVASFDQSLLCLVGSSYAGRASGSQALDVFMTLLSLGRTGYHSMIQKREDNFTYLKEQLIEFAQGHGEQVIESRDNFISLYRGPWSKQNYRWSCILRSVQKYFQLTNLFYSLESFYSDFGSHQSNLELPYLTVAAALGITREEIDKFFKIFHKCWTKLNQSLCENKSKK
ncbi:O-phosphoseryl-tRNA(Sec) selenium transferase-like [Drosophila obscura]|uniref:O-phosphoseryl-tRNA(Sec) selenium transferase-like n=1 Tax=Drosophila obscura TaxID=7282 RepID=UPI001BB0F8DB|nr:O-phosphoseryl-tRNA(Sec) selenium transferase-like [Drosophila obscura]